MSWGKYILDRGAVAKWLLHKNQGDLLRLKDICHYKGKGSDKSADDEFIIVTKREIDIKTAHRIVSEFIYLDLLIPVIDTSKVERLVINSDGKEKQIKRFIGWKSRPILSMFFKWIFSKLKDVILWLFTILAALAVRGFFAS